MTELPTIPHIIDFPERAAQDLATLSHTFFNDNPGYRWEFIQKMHEAYKKTDLINSLPLSEFPEIDRTVNMQWATILTMSAMLLQALAHVDDPDNMEYYNQRMKHILETQENILTRMARIPHAQRHWKAAWKTTIKAFLSSPWHYLIPPSLTSLTH